MRQGGSGRKRDHRASATPDGSAPPLGPPLGRSWAATGPPLGRHWAACEPPLGHVDRWRRGAATHPSLAERGSAPHIGFPPAAAHWAASVRHSIARWGEPLSDRSPLPGRRLPLISHALWRPLMGARWSISRAIPGFLAVLEDVAACRLAVTRSGTGERAPYRSSARISLRFPGQRNSGERNLARTACLAEVSLKAFAAAQPWKRGLLVPVCQGPAGPKW